MAQTRMPLVLISGFFGAGKTSLLKHLLTELVDQKIGVIMNEYGDVGIDGERLEDVPKVLEEINDGSIFCSCRHWEFVERMVEITKQDLDYIFVECSGMADPSPVKRDLEIIKSLAGDLIAFKGLVTIIDANLFLDLVDVYEIARRQVKHSSLILLNKMDLVDDNLKNRVINKLQLINKEVTIIPTTNSIISADDLLLELEEANQALPEDSVNEPDKKLVKIILSSNVPVELSRVIEFLNKYKGEILRLKGFCNTKNGVFYIDGLKPMITWQKVQLTRDVTEIVLIFPIGYKGDTKIRQEFTRLFS